LLEGDVMEKTNLDLGTKWQGRPLCCEYLLVHFASQPIRLRTGASARNWPVTWALGALSDGQREVAGAWLHSPEGALNWQAVFEDLAVRGVAQIALVVSADADAALATFPHSTELYAASTEPAHIGPPLTVLAPRLRRVADSVAVAAQLMQAGLARMIRRQGSFESPEAALLFLDAALQRLEARSRPQPRIRAVPAAPLRASARFRAAA
jgi:hypothetical protein